MDESFYWTVTRFFAERIIVETGTVDVSAFLFELFADSDASAVNAFLQMFCNALFHESFLSCKCSGFIITHSSFGDKRDNGIIFV